MQRNKVDDILISHRIKVQPSLHYVELWLIQDVNASMRRCPEKRIYPDEKAGRVYLTFIPCDEVC